jgi:beta-galactosidase
MAYPFRTCLLFVCFGLWFKGASAQVTYNNTASSSFAEVLPPSPAAGSSIDFDGLGWMVGGNRVFIQSGTLSYSRVPQPSWRDMLLALKRGGCNTVSTDVFWNYHEAKQGSMDFTTEGHNLGLFLDLAKELGLYVIIHAGPYTGSQWENGGLPTWLFFKDGMEIRKDNKPYLDAVDTWFAKLLPIIATRQINHSGNVILVQFEEQMPLSDGSDAYYQHLLGLATSNGIEVPIYFNGLHAGKDPAPEKPIDHAHRKTPWISTALWTTWFNRYGNDAALAAAEERSAWKTLALGGNGLNAAMFYGGTNFDYSASDSVMASYDFGAPLGQGGDPRDLYYGWKRMGYFTAAVSNILSGSMDATDQYQDFAIGARITARTAQAGTLVFLDNASDRDTTVVLKNGGSLHLGPGEVVALALQMPLSGGVVLSEADTRLLTVLPQDTVTTLICYGNPGERGRLTFGAPSGLSFGDGSRYALSGSDASEPPSFDPSGILTFQYPNSGILEEYLRSGTASFRILIMSKASADKTWIVDDAGGKLIVSGPPILGDFSLGDTSIGKMNMDYGWNDSPPTDLMVYAKAFSRKYPIDGSSSKPSPDSLKLTSWDMAPFTAAAEPRMSDKSWFSLTDGSPPEMGQDGDPSAYAWYRIHTTLTTPLQALEFAHIGDRATLFVDGKRAGSYTGMATPSATSALTSVITAPIPAGAHDLAIFVAHAGRPSLTGAVGAVHTLALQKGLRGPVPGISGSWKLKGGVDPNAIQLHWTSVPTAPEPRAGHHVTPETRAGHNREPEPRTGHGSASATASATASSTAPSMASATATSAAPLTASEEVPTFFRTHFMLSGDPEPGAVYRMISTGLSEGSVWINGHLVGRYPETLAGCPGIWLPSVWLRKGSNTLTILDETGAIPSAVSVQLDKPSSRHRVAVKPLTELQGIFQ